MPPVSEYRGPAAGRLAGLLLDIGGVVHSTGVRMVERLAETEPAMRPVSRRSAGSPATGMSCGSGCCAIR